MGSAAIGCRFFIGSVFLLAGLAKLPRRSEFEQVVRAYGILPRHFISPISRLIPLVEVALSALLLVGLGTRVVAAAVFAALAVFSAAAGFNLVRGRDLDCGCYAVGAPRSVTWGLIARNAALSAMALLVVGWAPPALALDSLFGGAGTSRVGSDDAIGLMLAATAAVLALTLTSEIARLRSVARSMDRLTA